MSDSARGRPLSSDLGGDGTRRRGPIGAVCKNRHRFFARTEWGGTAKGNGGFKAGHSHMRHILTKKSPKRKRQLGRTMQVHDSDVEGLRRLLPYV